MSPLSWPRPIQLMILVVFVVGAGCGWNLVTTGTAQGELESRARWLLEIQEFQFQVRTRIVSDEMSARISELEAEIAASQRRSGDPPVPAADPSEGWETLQTRSDALLQELEFSGVEDIEGPTREVRAALTRLIAMDDLAASSMEASNSLVPTLNDLVKELRAEEDRARSALQVRYQGLLALFGLLIALPIVAILTSIFYFRQQKRWEEKHGDAVQIQSDLRADMMAQERELLRARKPFAEMTAHLQTPVTVLKGVSGHLLDRAADEEDQRHLESVWAITRDLMNIVELADDYFRMTSGHFMPEQFFFDLDVMIEGVVQRMVPLARDNGLKLILRHSPEVPKQLEGDPSRLIQVLSILIERAVDATPRGWVLVEVDRVQKEGFVTITVEDTGQPIPESELDMVFDGLKLGLAHGLVERLGGTLDVVSERGRGTTFTLKLPLDPHASAEPPPEFLEGSRMLVVDDDPVNRDILQELLTAWGVSVRSCGSIEGALSALSTSFLQGLPYHILLVDETLSDGTGLTLCERVRNEPQYLQVAIVYFSELEQGIEILDMGVDDALTKPIMPTRFWKSLHRIGVPENEVTENTWLREKIRVLVVDPRGGRRMLAAGVLERLGCRVDEARTAEDAEALVRQLPYALAMVGGNQVGRRALDAIKRYKENLVVVAMVRTRGDEGRFLDAGADSCVRGTVDATALLAVFRRHQIGFDGFLGP